jgi:hypothetical protein
MEICGRTFELAKAHLVSLDYHGPVALACDDTKLFVALHLYWDKKEECYFPVGACGGPIRVPDVDAAQDVLADPKVKKATKVCNWSLSTPSQFNNIRRPDSLVVYDDPCQRGCADPPCYSPNR